METERLAENAVSELAAILQALQAIAKSLQEINEKLDKAPVLRAQMTQSVPLIR